MHILSHNVKQHNTKNIFFYMYICIFILIPSRGHIIGPVILHDFNNNSPTQFQQSLFKTFSILTIRFLHCNSKNVSLVKKLYIFFNIPVNHIFLSEFFMGSKCIRCLHTRYTTTSIKTKQLVLEYMYIKKNVCNKYSC